MSFDIAAFDTRTKSEKGAEMTILVPKFPNPPFLDPATGKPLTIMFLGRNSTAYKDVVRQINARAADMQRHQVPQTEEDSERDQVELLTAITVGWSFDTLDGQPFAFSPENARKLWADGRWPWLRVQATNFVSSEGNYLAGSSTV